MQGLEPAAKRVVADVGDGPEQRERHVLSDDGGDLQEPLVVRSQPVDARREHGLDGGRDLDRLDWLEQPIPSALSLERSGLHEPPDRLLEEERVSAAHQELLERREPGVLAEEGIQELAGALDGQRAQPYVAVVGLPAPGVLVLGPVRHQEQEPRGSERRHEAVEEGLRLGVDPVEVLDDEEQRLLSRLAQQEPSHRVQCALPSLHRAESPPLAVVHRHVDQRQERRQGRPERLVQREELAGDTLAYLAEIVAVLDLEVALEQVDRRQIAGGLAVGDRGALEDQPSRQAVRLDELVDQPGLADAGLADDRHDLAVPLSTLGVRAAQLLQLRVAADEARQTAADGGLEPRPRRAEPRDLVDLDGVDHALDRDRAERFHGDHALDESQRRRGQEDAAGHGELLHAGGQMRGLADGGVVHVQIAPDRPHDDLARVEPHADLHVHAVGAPRVLGVSLHRVLHAKRRIARADRMVLVGQRSTEQRHDPVAHHLVDGPLVAVDGIHHVRDDGVQELSRVLGIPIGEELHRALEIGEEDGDLFALAFEGAPGGQDLLGEMRRRVGLGRMKPRVRGDSGWRSASSAELRAGLVREAAGGTSDREPGAALRAEPAAGPVGGATPGTGHRRLFTSPIRRPSKRETSVGRRFVRVSRALPRRTPLATRGARAGLGGAGREARPCACRLAAAPRR